jgi:hypothetical protein
MIRASIGNAVIATAAPMNRVASKRVAAAANRPGTRMSHGVAATATANGTTMPAIETAAASRTFALKRSVLNVNPTTNM